MNKSFEVTAAGFDGSSDATDDRVFWVQADSAETVLAAIEGTGALFHDIIDGDSGIDFMLPKDEAQLRKKLASFNEQ
jgi:hypothetical protein